MGTSRIHPRVVHHFCLGIDGETDTPRGYGLTANPRFLGRQHLLYNIVARTGGNYIFLDHTSPLHPLYPSLCFLLFGVSVRPLGVSQLFSSFTRSRAKVTASVLIIHLPLFLLLILFWSMCQIGMTDLLSAYSLVRSCGQVSSLFD